MGRKKKGFNWKARQIVETKIDKSEQKKIRVELGEGKYDDCNTLVLPSKKRKTKTKKPNQVISKILSKTQRKRLEKIVEKKAKKENRGFLIEALSKVQVPEEELKQLTSLSSVQTKGLKRRWDEDKVEAVETSVSSTLNSVKGSKKRLRLLALTNDEDKKKKLSDSNVVGFESSSDEESDAESIKSEPLDSENELEVLQKQNDNPDDTLLISDEENSKPKEEIISTQTDKVSNGITTIKPKDHQDNVKTIIKKDIKFKPAVFVHVDRKREIQEARLKLPILGEEQIIMEAIKENSIVVIAGETGSGKTTQLPQFLYEAGFAMGDKVIGVTEPRRVAAISMSKRVGEELSLNTDKVSYLIRFEGNATPDTKIKFMTDGVLLKEMQSDFLLSKYSVVILDEAHERSVYTDILVGLLSRIVPLRAKKGNPLKMIIMSATLRLEDFTNNSHLFKTPPPVIKVESRQFPVTIHFNKRTNPDYIREAYKKSCRIHTTLPEGGILIFVTGQQEVNLLVKKLRQAFPLKPSTQKPEETTDKNEEEDEDLDLDKILEKVKKKRKKQQSEISLPQIDLDNYESGPTDDTDGDLLDLGESGDEDDTDWKDDIQHPSSQPLWVLPLYSLLPSHKQAKVFGKVPDGCRLCVVATNVAETSLTIPGVKYVVDTGKVKAKMFDKVTGVSAFSIVWASKAAANQRAGRAGRTSPGHCYRLYSSAVFNDEFQEWAVPEMQRRCVDDLVLQMKSLGIDRVSNFPFPSPPDRDQLKAAERRLTLLGAINPSVGPECSGKLTPLGVSMSAFPVAPRFAKMLCLSHQQNLLEYTVAIVAALSVQEFLMASDNQKTKAIWRKWAGKGNSLKLGDVMVLLRGICGGEYAHSKGELSQFCTVHGIREKAVLEARKLRIQITNEINLSKPELNLIVDPLLKPPSDLQAKLLRQIMVSGLVDHIAKKCTDDHEKKAKHRAVYKTPEMEDDAYIHSSSALYKEEPEWVAYQEIYETNKMYMRGITAVEADWLPVFATSMCSLSPPLDLPSPRYDPDTGQLYCHVNATFGRSGWELPLVEIEFPVGIDRYKWFSVFLLDGSIFPKLKKYVPSLLSPAQTMVKPWARLQDRTELLLKMFASEGIDSKQKLVEIWKSKPKFLLPAYLAWLPESAENEVTVNWPPVD